MIEYVEIRNTSRVLIGIIDTAQSIIWNSEYYGAGNFEIYVSATQNNISMLQVGNYITRPNDKNIGVIEGVRIEFSPQDGRMIIATGRFAKSLLDRRIIYNLSGTSITPTVSSGLVEAAVRKLVNDHIIASSQSARNVSFIKLGALKNLTARIIDDSGTAAQKQTSFGNLLEYTDGLLAEYSLGAFMTLDDSLNLVYNVFAGVDRSINNTGGNDPIIFSQDFDNLLSSTYDYQTAALKNTALIGGAGEGVDRFCVMIGVNATGLDRREVWIDANGQSRTYKDASDVEQTYTDAEYSSLLKTEGKQKISELQTVKTFDGAIDLTSSNLVFGTDYWIGDIITIQDVDLGIYTNTRILSATEVQDKDGYKIDIKYGE
ncbi:MAG: siphovirus ReqiPepy6 Gp37-like family protein [Monoglobaceae bacterium]